MHWCRRTDLQVATAQYSFAVAGGALGDLDLDLDTEIPAGSRLIHGYVVVSMPPTSAGASTLEVTVAAIGDVAGACPYDGAPWSARGRVPIVPVPSGAFAVRTTEAASTVRLAIAGAALTGGVFDVVLHFVETPQWRWL